jgi:hypothetical protein
MRIPWRRYGWAAALVGVGAASALLIALTPTFTGEDWHAIRHGAQLIASGQSPFLEPLYRWSPIAAWLTVPLLLLPYGVWVALHVAALAAIRNPWVTLVALISWPFWADAGVGNVVTFAVVAALAALRGSRVGTWIYLLMFLLIPRPLMIPVVIWLLFKRPGLRLPFAAAAAVSLLAALLTGYGVEWLGVLAHAGPVEIVNPYQIGPSRVIGTLWVPLGLALAAVLTLKGRLGLAGLAASPYWLPYYLMYGLLELDHDAISEIATTPQSSEAASGSAVSTARGAAP